MKTISQHGFVAVIKNTQTGQHLLRSTRFFDINEVICPFSAKEIRAEPNYLTVQVGDNKHITLQPEFLQYTNHSCAPNAFFDTMAMQLSCVKTIKEGDEITFFYPSSEWAMEQPFTCHCGAPECLGTIQGAAYLTMKVLEKYRLTDFIHQKIKPFSNEDPSV